MNEGEKLRVAHERGQREIFEQCTGYLTKVLEGSHNVIITTSKHISRAQKAVSPRHKETPTG